MVGPTQLAGKNNEHEGPFLPEKLPLASTRTATKASGQFLVKTGAYDGLQNGAAGNSSTCWAGGLLSIYIRGSILVNAQAGGWRLEAGGTTAETGWRLEAGGWRNYFRRPRMRPLSTFAVSAAFLSSVSALTESRKPSFSESDIWYSASRAEP